MKILISPKLYLVNDMNKYNIKKKLMPGASARCCSVFGRAGLGLYNIALTDSVYSKAELSINQRFFSNGPVVPVITLYNVQTLTINK